MVEHKPVNQPTVGLNQPVGVATLDPTQVIPGQTKVHFQNPQTETAFQGLTGMSEGIPPSNEAVIVGIEQAKQSILSSQSLLTREGKTIQRDTLILLDLIKMIIEDRNSDEKMQQFLLCFRNLSQKYAPEFGDDIRYGVKHGWALFFRKGGYESSQKGTGRDLYNSILGLRDFVFQVIRSADFRDAISELFQYLQILAGEVNVDEKGTGNILTKLASGIKSFGTEERSSSESVPETHDTTASVVSAVGGSLNLEHRQEETLLPSHVHSEDELKKNQGKLSEPGEYSQQYGNVGVGYQQRQQQPYGVGQQQQSTLGQQQPSSYQQQQPYGLGQEQPSTFSSGGGMGSVGNVATQEPYSGFGSNVPSSKPFQSYESNIPSSQSGISSGQQQPSSYQQQQQQPYGVGQELKSELKPTSLYGTSHQGMAPLEQSSQQQQGYSGAGQQSLEPSSLQQSTAGHFPGQNIVDDQYREPSEQSNVQAQQFRPVSDISQQQPYQQQSGLGQQQQWQPSDISKQQQQGFQSNIPQPPQQGAFSGQQYPQSMTSPISSGISSGGISQQEQQQQQQQPIGHDKNRREVEDSLIDRYVKLNKRFSKDPNYQRALYGLFNLFNEVKGLFGETATQGGEKAKTVERLTEDDDYRSLLNYAKLILYEFSDKAIFDKWLDTTNAFFVHLRTDERMKAVLRDIMNDFRRYGNQPTLLESNQEKEQLRQRLWQFRTVLEEKKNMDLTSNMLTYGRELLTSMRNDELNAEIRERSQKLISHLFLDDKGKFQLKPSALEQIRTILFVAIQEAINNWNTLEVEGDDGSQYFKISNIVLKANDILPDDVKFNVKNRTSMKYEELKPTDRLAESATMIGAHLFGMTAHLKDVGFMFDRRSFPSISDRGVMDIDFDRGGINVKLKLKARLSQNRPFYVKGINVGVDTLHIKFKQAEKHKIMLKMLSPIIQSRVRRKIHDNLEQAMNVNIRELIERLNDLIEQTIVQGNQMSGQGTEGGILTGILGRVGINTAGNQEEVSEWPQEGGLYSHSSSSGIHHSTPTSNVPVAHPVGTTPTRPVVQKVGTHERRTIID